MIEPRVITAISEFQGDLTRESLRASLDKTWAIRVTLSNEKQLITLAEMLGEPLPSPRNGSLIETLEVLQQDEATSNSMSSRFGSGSFPFHTDQAYKRVPPHYIILYHLPPLSYRATKVLFFPELFTPEKHDFLNRGIWSVNTGIGTFFTPILEQYSNSEDFHIRYDPCIMKPICSLAKKASALLEELIRTTNPVDHFYTEGECLILNNWKVLHGRGQGTPDEGTRTLFRVTVR